MAQASGMMAWPIWRQKRWKDRDGSETQCRLPWQHLMFDWMSHVWKQKVSKIASRFLA